MDFDLTTTAVIFVAIIVVGVGGLIAAPIGMTTSTTLMMVAPSMVVFGLIFLGLGMKYGEYRASAV
jgi:cytochrome bd-type quinol oxidase subunit 2